MRCAGILLTGGRSTRMGRDKATIVIDAAGTTLAVRAAASLAAVTEPVVEVGDGASGQTAVREDPPGEGPLAAIAAGWASLTGSAEEKPDAAIVLACDMPNADERILRWLADHEAEGSVVPVVGRHPQPLCARWSAAALDGLVDRLAAGERSLRGLVEADDVTLVAETEWRRAGHGAALGDVDTPADLRRLVPDAPAPLSQ
jgi:molybdopterin-guanine dinucleotide biosynthesis protein A